VINLVETSSGSVHNALNSSIQDAIHFYTAIDHKLDYTITNDIDFLKLNGDNLVIKTPKQFLQNL